LTLSLTHTHTQQTKVKKYPRVRKFRSETQVTEATLLPAFKRRSLRPNKTPKTLAATEGQGVELLFLKNYKALDFILGFPPPLSLKSRACNFLLNFRLLKSAFIYCVVLFWCVCVMEKLSVSARVDTPKGSRKH